MLSTSTLILRAELSWINRTINSGVDSAPANPAVREGASFKGAHPDWKYLLKKNYFSYKQKEKKIFLTVFIFLQADFPKFQIKGALCCEYIKVFLIFQFCFFMTSFGHSNLIENVKKLPLNIQHQTFQKYTSVTSVFCQCNAR